MGALSVPQDEVVFHLFASQEVTLVRDVCRMASLPVERVVESIVIVPDSTSRLPRVGRQDCGSSDAERSSPNEPSLTPRASSVRERMPSFE